MTNTGIAKNRIKKQKLIEPQKSTKDTKRIGGVC